MSYYFSEHSEVPDKPSLISYRFHGRDLVFHSNSGVFSKEHIDQGTETLLDAFYEDMEKLKDENLELFGSLTKGQALDLGTGYGAIAIVAKKLYPASTWTLSDVNDHALDLARKNLEENFIQGSRVIKSDGFEHLEGSFDLILSNPPIRVGKDKLYELFRGMQAHLSPEGRAYIVIGKKQGAKSAQTYLESLFSQVDLIYKKKGFHILRLQAAKDEEA